MKTCSCGKLFILPPNSAKLVESAYWFNCKCRSTLLVPEQLVLRTRSAIRQTLQALMLLILLFTAGCASDPVMIPHVARAQPTKYKHLDGTMTICRDYLITDLENNPVRIEEICN